MRVGIVGAGPVGRDLGHGFLKRGHEVMVGSRSPDKLEDWLTDAGDGASTGTMTEAAVFGELLVVCSKGTELESVVAHAGAENMAHKVVIDTTNPLVFHGEGQMPSLLYGPEDSGGETLQRAVPEAKVVKSFGIVNSGQMIDPVTEDPTMFVAGEDAEAKETVTHLLRDFGWADVIDLGGIEASREMESLCVLWCRIALPADDWSTAFKVLR